MKACRKPLSGLELSHPTFAVVALAGNVRLMCWKVKAHLFIVTIGLRMMRSLQA